MNDINIRQKVRLNVKLDKIQMIRLIGALLETDYDFDFPTESKAVLDYLRHHFDIKYSIDTEGLPVIEDVSIVHEEQPMCKIGSLKKPLIYPKEMLNKCKAKWSNQKDIRFSFVGLVTPKRKQSLDKWISLHFSNQNIGRNKVKISRNSKKGRLFNALISLIKRCDNKIIIDDIGLQILTSNQGRKFPVKAWDEEYYDILAKTQFVLCPDGDFTWTYRFFEAIICGAIPIIENSCELYEGFEYFSMKDPIEELIYVEEVAARNFQKLQREFTFRKEDLNNQIEALIRSSTQTC